MTREETKQLIAMMMVTYPNYHPADITYTVNVWASMLMEYDFQQVQIAFKKYVLTNTSGFAPSIGQIVEQLQGVTEENDIGELQAWSMVSGAIRNSIYSSENEFEKLPPVVQRAVGNASNLKEWAMMDADTVNSVIQSNVIRNYRAAAKAMRDEAKLPPKFRELIANLRTTPERLTRPEINQIEERKETFPGKDTMQEQTKEKLEELRRKFGGELKNEEEN